MEVLELMKKFITIMSIVSLLLTTACSNQSNDEPQVETSTTTTQSIDLVDKATELASNISLLSNDELYISSFTNDSVISSTIDKIATQDLSTPTDIYKLSGIDKSYQTLMSYMGNEVPEFENSKIEEIYKDKLISSLPTILNSASGSAILASTAILTSDDVFLYPDLTEREIYLLLYDGGFNVLVLFVPKGEGIVTANASIVTNEMLSQIQSDGEISGTMKLGISFAGIGLEKLL